MNTNMNKFNSHLHSARDVCRMETVSEFSYDSMFYIIGARTDKNGNFSFFKNDWKWISDLNSSDSKIFKVPIRFAIVKHCKWEPEESIIYVNNTKYETFDSMIGLIIKKDDEIRATFQPNSRKLFCLETVVTSPTIK